jgi:AcrR family transcriptional regulator
VAWDTRATRAALLAAAVDEFSEHGFAGGRIERISSRAGVNRERIYSYFGGKEALFQEVLSEHLGVALDGTPLRGDGPPALGDFAGRYFDFTLEHPSLARLVFWEGLELEELVNTTGRCARAGALASAIRTALPPISDVAAQDLLLTIVTLCYGWRVSPNLTRVITSADPDHRHRRGVIVRTATLLAADAVTAASSSD